MSNSIACARRPEIVDTQHLVHCGLTAIFVSLAVYARRPPAQAWLAEHHEPAARRLAVKPLHPRPAVAGRSNQVLAAAGPRRGGNEPEQPLVPQRGKSRPASAWAASGRGNARERTMIMGAGSASTAPKKVLPLAIRAAQHFIQPLMQVIRTFSGMPPGISIGRSHSPPSLCTGVLPGTDRQEPSEGVVDSAA